MAIIVQDDFTEGANTDLQLHTPTPTGDGWTEEENTTATEVDYHILAADDFVSMDPAADRASSRIIMTAQPNPTETEYDVEVTVLATGVSTDDPFFLIARLTATTDYYSAGSYPGGAAADKKIFKRIGGTPTELATGDSGLAANDVLCMQVRDTNPRIRLLKNAVEELTSNDADITAAGRAGFGSGNSWVSTDDVGAQWQLDDFSIDEISAASTGVIPFSGVTGAAVVPSYGRF